MYASLNDVDDLKYMKALILCSKISRQLSDMFQLYVRISKRQCEIDIPTFS